MRTIRKLRSQGGFTLAETLLAVLIMLLVSVIVATGIPAARNAYEKVVVAANGQVLLSTAATALRDELGTAWDVKIDDKATSEGSKGTFVVYNSANTGGQSKIYLDANEGIKLQEYKKVNVFNIVDDNFFNNDADEKSYIDESDSRRLVAEKAGPGDSSGNLKVTYEEVSYTNNSVVFSKLSVGSAAYPDLASIDTLTIPVISAKTA